MCPTQLVLIVDDDPSVRSSLHSLVRSIGCEARTFESGDSLLLSEAGEIAPADCVICDINMPGISGIELQAALCRRGVTIAFIFLSAYLTERVRDAALAGGALCVLEKPADPDLLCRWLVIALERSRSGSTAA
ncbi:response regulator transcription factor [Burkholderia gladioli]|uniref:response regulator transcription factor n=1 Tax=Burkholderia gladioli TaxID=28095 RepID=UPI002FE18897